MTKELMIYENVVPVSSVAHQDVCVAHVASYEFAGETNAVPLLAAEVPLAAREYAVVFAGDDEAPMPTAILGAGGTNAYVATDGSLNARYVPAFLRRHPFVFSKGEADDRFTPCLDKAFEGVNRGGRGERLFDSAGERTAICRRPSISPCNTKSSSTQRAD